MRPSTSQSHQKPNWNRLYTIAEADEGYFTTSQAAEAGYSRPLLAKYIANGRIRRARHGVYRLVHFPTGEHEDLVVIWLWSGQHGVFSYEPALSLHQLSDILPAKIHLTVPKSWDSRRLRVPNGLVLHYADIEVGEKTWVGAVPVTSPKQTVLDC
jgi:predicted transcriptional regulator of viral defense system